MAPPRPRIQHNMSTISTSASQWNDQTFEKKPQFMASDVPDLSGFVVFVTGGNSGIGYETALQLALHGARVYIGGRSPERMDKAIRQMKGAHTQKRLDVRPLEMDMLDLKSVRDAAEKFMEEEAKLDILINNAGIMAVPYELSEDGFELMWQTNHLAPFLLTKALLPSLERGAKASESKSRVRVVNISADAAFRSAPKGGQLDLERPNLEYLSGATAPWKRYGHSKVASIVHAQALDSRLRGSGITAYSLHPGIIMTNLQAADPTFVGSAVRFLVRWHVIPGTVSISDGARTTLFCATSRDAVKDSGGYFMPFGKHDKRADKWKKEEGLLERLWVESEKILERVGF